jgi:hypothetical protein
MTFQILLRPPKPVKYCPHGRPVTSFADCGLCNAQVNQMAIARLAERAKKFGLGLCVAAILIATGYFATGAS